MEMLKKASNFCYGKYNLTSCEAWAGSLSGAEIAIVVAGVFIALFIIFRIFHAIIGNFDLW